MYGLSFPALISMAGATWRSGRARQATRCHGSASRARLLEGLAVPALESATSDPRNLAGSERASRGARERGIQMALAHRVLAALFYPGAAGRHSHRRVPDGPAGTASPRDRRLSQRVLGRYPELVLSHTPLAPAVACERIEEVPRRMHGLPISLRRPMGRDIQAIKISGEDRGKYRAKLARSLDVYARMLHEHMFHRRPDSGWPGDRA